MTNHPLSEEMRQRTLAKPFYVLGRGIHTDDPVSMTVHPGAADAGIAFLRSDQPPSRGLIRARWSCVVNTRYSTDIGNEAGVTVRSVEHLLAGLRIAGVDNALVELNGPEVPSLDGSAAPFLRLIDNAGTVEQDAAARSIVVLRPVGARDGARYARLMPSPVPRLFVTIDYPGTPIGTQSLGAVWNRTLFRRDIAAARTFGFAADHAAMMAEGYALGAGLTNTIVVDGDGIRVAGGLRYSDEFVRHKMLDAIGDLTLAGWPIRADYEGCKPGHTLNVRLLQALFHRGSDAWTLEPSVLRGVPPL